MEFKPIWSGEDWELLVNDKDEFLIYDLQSHAELHISKDDKTEFQKLIQMLSSELWQESVNFVDK